MTSPSFSPIGIRFENIDKRYGGLYALRRVSLEIAAGECVVFAGRNGSGKTTLLRIAARLARPSSGSISWVNSRGEKNETVLPAGFVAHATMVYDELTAEENLLLFARLQGIAEPAARAEKLLREVGLEERRKSLGVNWFAETIRGLRDSGRTILMSLHGESEVSNLATRAIQLDAGSVVADTRTGANFRSILSFANA